VVEKDNNMPKQFEAFWTELGMNSDQVKSLTNNTNIHVKTFGSVSANSFVSAIDSFGFSQDLTKSPSLMVVITDDYQHSGIAEINNYSLRYKIPWVMVKSTGLKLMVGPFISPYKTACWQCLDTRLRHNKEVESYIQKKTNKTEPFPVTKTQIPLAELQVVSIATMQMVQWLAKGFHNSLESKIMTIDLMTAFTQYHHVTKRPQCVSCGNPEVAKNAALPIQINSKKALGKSGNGSRMETAENTFNRYQHHVSELTGIVKGIFPAAWNGIGPIKVYMAGHNFALKNDDIFFIKDGLRSNSSGKGRTDAQAKTSALCEALERYSGVFRGEEEQLMSTYKALGDKAIDPRTVLLYSKKQYKERVEWLNKGRFQVVPEAFKEDSKISWSPLWSMTEKKVKYLPTSYLYFGFKDSDEKFFCWGDSNGNAAGSCNEDAILQGFLELIERDSVALWWYNSINRKAVDLDSLNDSFVNELQEFYKGMNREFWVLDLTADTGIPAFVAINRRTNHKQEDIIMGFGAHVDSRIAINRAITEMNQFIPAVLNIDDNGDSQYHFDDPVAINWWETATIENQPYLVPAKGKIHIDQLPSCKTIDLKEQLEICIKAVVDLGLEMLVLNQTRPDVGLPVMKVVVPGLRHFWARFDDGRLYDVPVKMGWLKKKKTESQLNPIPMFL
jgi:ribosomal protein S12 methylthiotransferase accessory factor